MDKDEKGVSVISRIKTTPPVIHFNNLQLKELAGKVTCPEKSALLIGMSETYMQYISEINH